MSDARKTFRHFNNTLLIVPLGAPFGLALGLAIGGYSPPLWPLFLHPFFVAFALFAWSKAQVRNKGGDSTWTGLETKGGRLARAAVQSLALATMAVAATLMVRPWMSEESAWQLSLPFILAGALSGLMLATLFLLRWRILNKGPFRKLVTGGPALMTVLIPVGGAPFGLLGGVLLLGLPCWNNSIAGSLAGLGLGLESAVLLLSALLWILVGLAFSLIQVSEDKAILEKKRKK